MGIFGQAFSLIAVLYKYRSLFLMWITCGQTGFFYTAYPHPQAQNSFIHKLFTTIHSFLSTNVDNYLKSLLF